MDDNQDNTPNPEVQKLHDAIEADPGHVDFVHDVETEAELDEILEEANEPRVDLPWPQYKCHKIVRAIQVAKVRAPRKGTVTLELVSGYNMDVTTEWAQTHSVQSGGYLIEYADDYISFSPQEAFEDGYGLIVEGGEG